MQLVTKAIEKQLEQYPLGSQDGKGVKAKAVVKYFNPCGAGTWIVTEGEKQGNGKYLFFGFACITDWEWGYFSQEELEMYKGPLGLGIERDLSSYTTVEDCLKRMCVNLNKPRNGNPFKSY